MGSTEGTDIQASSRVHIHKILALRPRNPGSGHWGSPPSQLAILPCQHHAQFLPLFTLGEQNANLNASPAPLLKLLCKGD
jgi:hypothetical protein